MNDLCPCGSTQKAIDCCLRFIRGSARASTAEALMRSRYTAYVLAEAAYLSASWHESCRPLHIDLTTQVEWLGLSICRVQAGQPGDSEGFVEFMANYREAGKFAQIHELSRFVQEEGRWFYLDGEHKDVILPSRNAACPCGSGKKFKHCCRP